MTDVPFQKYFTYCQWEINEIIYKKKILKYVACIEVLLFWKAQPYCLDIIFEVVAGKAQINTKVILLGQTVCTLYQVIMPGLGYGRRRILTNRASRTTKMYHSHKVKASSHCKGNSFWLLVFATLFFQSWSPRSRLHLRVVRSRLSGKSEASLQAAAPVGLSIPLPGCVWKFSTCKL